jgi:hypothetical protein
MCDDQFQRLNFPTGNGHILAMGDDAHRSELLANGNLLAIYYNSLNTGWTSNSGTVSASLIDQYSQSLFTNTGPRPNWIVLNEISAGSWPTNQTYRTWVHDVVHALHNTYNYSVILYAPFANPGANSSDWQAVSADAYIAVENYLSGEEVLAQNFSVSWCQSQYHSSITSYNAVGVPTSRLILGEHFAQTVSGTGYGRSGVASNDWDSAIIARDKGALNAGFAGFIGYAWDKDAMNEVTNEMMHFEDTYASNPLPAISGVTLPYLLQQPEDQVVPPGGTATFNAFPAGTNAVSYQWRFNGTNLPGAASFIYTLTNASPVNAGNYSVLLSNAAGTTLGANAVLSVRVPDPLAADPFAPASTNRGTAYAPGTDLIGQTNAQNLAWSQAGPNSGLTGQPLINSGSLQINGLAAATGNSVSFGGNGTTARFAIFPDSSGITSGTVYYSFALKFTDITGLSSSGIFWAGFNNSKGFQTNTPTSVGTRVYTRAAGNGFNIGLSKASGTSSDWIWDNTVHSVNELIFLVGSYAVNTASSTDDAASLWINPAPSMFGAALPPAPTLTTSSGSDIPSNIVRSFLIMNRDPSEPAAGIIDELRIGTTWASVTPPAQPRPLLNFSVTGNYLILSWSTNSTGFTLEASPSPSPSSSWFPVSQPVSVENDQYTVTNQILSATQYFRLQGQ